MILSTRNFEYALQLQSTKTIFYSFGETPNAVIDAFLLFKNNYMEGSGSATIK